MAFYYTNQIKREVGEKIEKIRKKKNMKQVEVAVAAGVNPSYFSKIERGEVNPSLEKIYRIVKALGVDTSDILPF